MFSFTNMIVQTVGKKTKTKTKTDQTGQQPVHYPAWHYHQILTATCKGDVSPTHFQNETGVTVTQSSTAD